MNPESMLFKLEALINDNQIDMRLIVSCMTVKVHIVLLLAFQNFLHFSLGLDSEGLISEADAMQVWQNWLCANHNLRENQVW